MSRLPRAIRSRGQWPEPSRRPLRGHARGRTARAPRHAQEGIMNRKDEPMTADVSAVEYLYGTRVEWPDDGPEIREVVPFRITRKTAKRIYYVRGKIGHTGRLD